MSTVKRNIVFKRFAQLTSLNEIVFTFKDLANLWGIINLNTLYTTLKRYTQNGLLYRVHRGLYSIKPIFQVDPYLLGIKALHQYSYVSTESVLFDLGIINQKIDYITLVSSSSKRFTIVDNNYIVRQLKDDYLYNDSGIIERDGIRIATLERAIADLLYFNPKYHFDAHNLINWLKVKKLQKIIGYK